MSSKGGFDAVVLTGAVTRQQTGAAGLLPSRRHRVAQAVACRPGLPWPTKPGHLDQCHAGRHGRSWRYRGCWPLRL